MKAELTDSQLETVEQLLKEGWSLGYVRGKMRIPEYLWRKLQIQDERLRVLMQKHYQHNGNAVMYRRIEE